MRTTEQVLKEVAEAQQITEADILLIKNRKNNGKEVDESIFWDGDIEVTPKQGEKGINFLRNQYVTPKGKTRKNNPFGYREIEVLNSYKYFTFDGFYDAGNGYRSYYLPIYTCCGTEGCFQYYYNGEINIIG